LWLPLLGGAAPKLSERQWGNLLKDFMQQQLKEKQQILAQFDHLVLEYSVVFTSDVWAP
jgi:hypothetical protein